MAQDVLIPDVIKNQSQSEPRLKEKIPVSVKLHKDTYNNNKYEINHHLTYSTVTNTLTNNTVYKSGSLFWVLFKILILPYTFLMWLYGIIFKRYELGKEIKIEIIRQRKIKDHNKFMKKMNKQLSDELV